MNRGLTLIESLMSIVLAGIILFVIAFFIREGFEAWNFTLGQNHFIFSGRAALNRITHDIKLAKNNASITVFTSTEVKFTDVSDNSIDFCQSGTNLLRNQDIILDNLKLPNGLSLIYLDGSGTATSFKDQIRSIRARISVENGENKFTIESAAGIRND